MKSEKVRELSDGLLMESISRICNCHTAVVRLTQIVSQNGQRRPPFLHSF